MHQNPARTGDSWRYRLSVLYDLSFQKFVGNARYNIDGRFLDRYNKLGREIHRPSIFGSVHFTLRDPVWVRHKRNATRVWSFYYFNKVSQANSQIARWNATIMRISDKHAGGSTGISLYSVRIPRWILVSGAILVQLSGDMVSSISWLYRNLYIGWRYGGQN